MAGGFKIMLERVVGAVIVFAGGDFGSGANADVTVVPGFVEAGGAIFVNVDRLGHRAAGKSLGETVDETVFVRIGLEPLPLGVASVEVGV